MNEKNIDKKKFDQKIKEEVIDKLNIKYEIIRDTVKIFNIIFVKNNRDKCYIIHENKKYELQKEFTNINPNNLGKILEIELIGVNNIINMSNMFGDCISLLSISNLEKLNTNKIHNLSYMFYSWESLKSLPDISNWDISNTTDISGMFYGCKSLTVLPDISKWNINNVTNISY